VAAVGAILAAHFGCFLVGLDHTSLPAAVALVSLEPLSVVLWAWAMHRLRPTGLEAIGVLGATAGAGLVARGAGVGTHRLVGDLFVVAAVVLYGGYVNAARLFRGELPARRYAALVYLASALGSALALPLVDGSTPGRVWPLPPHALVGIAALALLPTLVGHTAVQAAARHTSPSIVALVSPAETLGSLAISAALLGERPSPVEAGGAAVILASVTVALLGARADEHPVPGD
jgi:drug/metabolite transporter (DMT)-like permease